MPEKSENAPAPIPRVDPTPIKPTTSPPGDQSVPADGAWYRRALSWVGHEAGRAVIGTIVGALVLGGAALLWKAFTAEGDKGSPSSISSVEPDGHNCPSDHAVKGNISEEGERIYHLPGWRYYDSTYPEACFKSSQDAEEAGYRASKVQ